ncbi:MAG TPA: hypothetical protein VLF71_00485 [Candidatus Saccharimonadales bacterium]|nr:hypothetical protein [Candidatus Saccharimonadales bacterium]
MATLQLDTVHSTWIHPYVPEAPEPYHRVITVGTASGVVACEYEVDTSDVQSFAFNVPEDMAERVARFFKAYVAGRSTDPADPSFSHREAYSERPPYNCHAFARYVITGADHEGFEYRYDGFGSEAAKTAQPFTGNLEAGQHGVVFSRPNNHTSHSFLGLGRHAPFTLQAMNNHGNIGLLPYNQILPIYGKRPEDRFRMLAVPLITP